MPVSDICKKEVAFVGKNATVAEAARLMRRYHVGSLVVIDQDQPARKPVGIVTDRDLVVEVYALGLDASVITVGDIMIPELVTVPTSFGILETTQLMRMKGVRRIPVVDEQGALVGIVTIDDILNMLADELNEIARTLSHEQSREVRMRAA